LAAAGSFCAMTARSRGRETFSPPTWAKTRSSHPRRRRPSACLSKCLPPSRQPPVRAGDGNAASFACAYHGWTCRNDGRLVGVPYLQEAHHGEFDRERLGFTPVAQLDSDKGLLFATFDRTKFPRRRPPRRRYNRAQLPKRPGLSSASSDGRHAGPVAALTS